MTHDWHDAHPSYSPAQVLHDGCRECRHRGDYPGEGIAALDRASFAAAWQRAAAWKRNGLPDISAAEQPVLDVLWAVQCQLEVLGVPIGTLPEGPAAAAAAALTADFPPWHAWLRSGGGVAAASPVPGEADGSGETVFAATPEAMRKLLEERS